MGGISWFAENRLASEEELCCMEWVKQVSIAYLNKTAQGLLCEAVSRRYQVVVDIKTPRVSLYKYECDLIFAHK